jgi:hypothetical protein
MLLDYVVLCTCVVELGALQHDFSVPENAHALRPSVTMRRSGIYAERPQTSAYLII